MHRFYAQVPTMTAIYHKGYMLPKIPMEGLIVTSNRDHFRCYSKGTPQENWQAEDYAKEFIAFHEKEEKPYRVSAITPDCPGFFEKSCDASTAHPDGTYSVIVNATGGKLYPVQCDQTFMSDALTDYAKQVAFRAFVDAKQLITLTKKPATPLQMRVSVADVILAGNTGADTDRWAYLPATNQVQMYWERIDDVKLMPGDRLKIVYKALGN
jgi:hypothetical protein